MSAADMRPPAASAEQGREQEQPPLDPPRPACPVCGAGLTERRGKLICTRCHTICETCCEGGRG